MGKTGCPVCGKAYGAGHFNISDCPMLKTPVTVERIPRKELAPVNVPVKVPVKVPPSEESTLTAPNSTLTEGEEYVNEKPAGTLTSAARKQTAWEKRQHPEDPGKWRRDYQREYMRRRRAQ